MMMRLVLALAVFTAACGGSASLPTADDFSNGRIGERTRLGERGPEVIGGLYDAWGSCPFAGCDLGEVMAKQAITLFDRPGPGGKPIATMPQGEWALITNTILRHRPPRGVVVGPITGVTVPQHTPAAALNRGEEVFILDYFASGEVQLLRGADLFIWKDNRLGDQIRFEAIAPAQHLADKAAGAGWWIELRRANQQSGWLFEAGQLDCLGRSPVSQACLNRTESAHQR
jgi:hypothetical protein